MRRKAYWQMTPAELAAATRPFDEEFVADQSRPLTTAEREQWNRLKRQRRRPKVGPRLKRVSVSLEQELLQRVTALAKKRRISRSKLFTQMIEEALAHAQ
jgi:hypothetical protein